MKLQKQPEKIDLNQILEQVQGQLQGKEKISSKPHFNRLEVRKNFIAILMNLCLKNSNGKRQFQLDAENEKVVEFFCRYLNNEIDTSKGICLLGNFGSGKTLLMQGLVFFKKFYFNETVGFKTTTDINSEFIRFDPDTKKIAGMFVVNKYSKPDERIFDDLGTEETTVQEYGNKFSPMAQILSNRYQNGITHITTNLDLSELGEMYGGRMESRFHEMFYLVKLGINVDSVDYRKIN